MPSAYAMEFIMRRVSWGWTNAQIGESIGKSAAWTEKRLQEIYAALDCKSATASTRRAEGVARAIRVGVIQ